MELIAKAIVFVGAVVGAIVMAHYDMEGYGWLIFVAVLAALSVL